MLKKIERKIKHVGTTRRIRIHYDLQIHHNVPADHNVQIITWINAQATVTNKNGCKVALSVCVPVRIEGEMLVIK